MLVIFTDLSFCPHRRSLREDAGAGTREFRAVHPAGASARTRGQSLLRATWNSWFI